MTLPGCATTVVQKTDAFGNTYEIVETQPNALGWAAIAGVLMGAFIALDRAYPTPYYYVPAYPVYVPVQPRGWRR